MKVGYVLNECVQFIERQVFKVHEIVSVTPGASVAHSSRLLRLSVVRYGTWRRIISSSSMVASLNLIVRLLDTLLVLPLSQEVQPVVLGDAANLVLDEPPAAVVTNTRRSLLIVAVLTLGHYVSDPQSPVVFSGPGYRREP